MMDQDANIIDIQYDVTPPDEIRKAHVATDPEDNVIQVQYEPVNWSTKWWHDAKARLKRTREVEAEKDQRMAKAARLIAELDPAAGTTKAARLMAALVDQHEGETRTTAWERWHPKLTEPTNVVRHDHRDAFKGDESPIQNTCDRHAATHIPTPTISEWRDIAPLSEKDIKERTGLPGVEIRTPEQLADDPACFTGLLLLKGDGPREPKSPPRRVLPNGVYVAWMDLAHPSGNDDPMDWRGLLDCSRDILDKLSKHQYVVILCSYKNKKDYRRHGICDLPSLMACMVLIKAGLSAGHAVKHVEHTKGALWVKCDPPEDSDAEFDLGSTRRWPLFEAAEDAASNLENLLEHYTPEIQSRGRGRPCPILSSPKVSPPRPEERALLFAEAFTTCYQNGNFGDITSPVSTDQELLLKVSELCTFHDRCQQDQSWARTQ